jgi:hypothetical protein
MAYEQFFGDQERFWGWRCIFCGEIVDDVILENRQWLKTGVMGDNKKPERPSQEGKGELKGSCLYNLSKHGVSDREEYGK